MSATAAFFVGLWAGIMLTLAAGIIYEIRELKKYSGRRIGPWEIK